MEASVPISERCCRLPQDGRASHAYLHALIENNPTAVVVLDSDHRFQLCNAAFARLFQYAPSELETCGIDALLATPDYLDEADEATRSVLLGRQVRLRTRRRRKDGWLINVNVIGVPLLIEGRVEGVFGLYQATAQAAETVEGRQAPMTQQFGVQSADVQRFPPGRPSSLSQELIQLNSSLHSLGTLLTSAGDNAAEVSHSTRELAALCGSQIRSLEQQLSGVERTTCHGANVNAEGDSHTSTSRVQSMTGRETEIVTLLAGGLSSKEVAVRLDIGTRTVETHRLNVYRKLQLRNIADLVLYAVRNGLLSPG